MSSSLLSSGGGRAYRFESLDLDIIKSPSSSWISNSSSPSSTLSESSNCPFAISTRKPRTPRKRPNQTYNEAAAILSTAYPKIFPTKHLVKSGKLKKSNANEELYMFESADLLMPFQVIDNRGFLLHRSSFAEEAKGRLEKTCPSPGEINSLENSSEICGECGEDFDAESILDEEIGEGIDSIMGNLSVEKESSIIPLNSHNLIPHINSFCYGYPIDFAAYGMRKELRAIRNVDEGDWWRFPIVNVGDLNPKSAKIPCQKKKMKKKVVETKNSDAKTVATVKTIKEVSDPKSPPSEEQHAGLILKLNYDVVLREWSDKDSPFSGDFPVSESAGNDVQTRLSQIDLFSENGGVREARVLRYKEKRRTRLFSKQIRYQVRKVNADRRPRMKGRFVRTPDDFSADE